VVEATFFSEDPAAPALAYAALGPSVRDLGLLSGRDTLGGIAENVTVMPKTTLAADAALGRSERILTVKERTPRNDVLRRNGFTDAMLAAIDATLQTVCPSTELPAGARLRILFGPSRTSNTLIPYRM